MTSSTPLDFSRDFKKALDSVGLIDIEPTSTGTFHYAIPGVKNPTTQATGELALLEGIAKATDTRVSDELRTATTPANLTAFLHGHAYVHAWMEDERVYRRVQFSNKGTREKPYRADIVLLTMNGEPLIRTYTAGNPVPLYAGVQSTLNPVVIGELIDGLEREAFQRTIAATPRKTFFAMIHDFF